MRFTSKLAVMLVLLSVVSMVVPMFLTIQMLLLNNDNDLNNRQFQNPPSQHQQGGDANWQLHRERDAIIHQCIAMPECKKDWNWTEPCTFYERGTGPIPVVLMALGRSGSSITWSTMSALTGERNVAYERTGQTIEKTENFFACLEKCPLAYHNWTIQSLCHIQRRRPDVTINSGIAGFQWKP